MQMDCRYHYGLRAGLSSQLISNRVKMGYSRYLLSKLRVAGVDPRSIALAGASFAKTNGSTVASAREQRAICMPNWEKKRTGDLSASLKGSATKQPRLLSAPPHLFTFARHAQTIPVPMMINMNRVERQIDIHPEGDEQKSCDFDHKSRMKYLTIDHSHQI